MLKEFSLGKAFTRYNSPKNRNNKQKLKKNKSLINIKVIKPKLIAKGSKTPNYSNMKYNISNILNFDKNLTQKEKVFKQNISNKIIINKALGEKITNNVSLLENKIIDSYYSLKNSDYNYHQTNKNIIKELHNKKRLKILNREYNNIKLNVNNIKITKKY